MLRRANDLTARARARIRAAREHDPHAWPELDPDRAILVHDDPAPIDFVQDFTDYEDDDTRDNRPPLGSPEQGAPDVDGAVGPGGVSGPPAGGRPHRPGERTRRLMTGAPPNTPPEAGGPNGPRHGGRLR